MEADEELTDLARYWRQLILGTIMPGWCLSLPKIPSGRIRVVTENQRIIAFDARDPPLACSIYRQPVQVAASA